MAVMQTKSFLVSRGGKVLEVVVECSAGDVWGGRAEGFFGCLVLDGRDVVPGRVPDVLDRVVVGRVRRRMDRRDALQQPAGLVEAGQRFRVVGSGVVWDDRDLAGLGFSLEQVQRADCLPGVLVLLGRVRRDCSAGREGGGVGEGLGRLLPVHGRSGALSFWRLHAAGLGLVLQADLAPCGVDLPAGVQQGLDLGRRPGHAFGGGFLVAVLVERVRAVRGSARTSAGAAGTRSPTGVPRRTGSSRRHVGPGRPRTRRGRPSGGRPGQDGPGSSFRARVSSAASWFPACPVRTEHILVAHHSVGHSCTVLSVRSTPSARPSLR